MLDIKKVVSLAILGMTLTACGQKGDLYLPKDGKTTIAAPQAKPIDTAHQPTVTGDTQNPNITDTNPTDPQSTAKPKDAKGNANDY